MRLITPRRTPIVASCCCYITGSFAAQTGIEARAGSEFVILRPIPGQVKVLFRRKGTVYRAALSVESYLETMVC